MLDRTGWISGIGLLAAIVAARPALATFTNVTAGAGINYSFDPLPPPPAPFNTPFPEFYSGGAAARDYDNDGWVDLYVTRYFASDILYHNNGNGTFSDVTNTAFGALPTRNTNGAAWGDIDNDGDSDLYVASINQSQHFLYVNDGAGHFTEEAVTRGAAVGDSAHTTSGTSTSFGDYDGDGWLDMYVGEWRDIGVVSVPAQARLLHNLGASNPGHFEDVTVAAGVAMDLTSGPRATETHSFTPRFVDLDRDGRQDLAVASDYGTSRMFWNNGNGTFTDGTAAMASMLGATDMGLAIGDVNGDQRLDWFTTDVYIQGNPDAKGNRLLLNNGDRTFTDATPPIPPSGPNNTIRNSSWGWGTDMFDYDNDNDLDVIATNGYYYHDIGLDTDRTRLFENNGSGSFTEKGISNLVFDTGQGRGLLTFDYDQDGDLDVFIVNNHQAPILYRNNGNANKWLNIDLEGTISNRDGIGAVITVTPDTSLPNKMIVTEVDGSSNYVAQSQETAHFGLGALVGTIDLIQIEWPASGIVQRFTDVAPNQLLTIVEPIADYNDDGVVDALDYCVWRNSIGTPGITPGDGADGNGDGTIDEDDFTLWMKSYGRTVVTPGGGAGGGDLGGAAIPEPPPALLLAGGFLGWGIARKSRQRMLHPRI